MARRRNGGLPQYDQALFCWNILIGRAQKKKLITFTQLSEKLGHRGKGAGVPYFLRPLQIHCLAQELPLISALVVKNGTTKPGKSYIGELSQVEEERARVFKFAWSTIPKPTPEDLGLPIR